MAIRTKVRITERTDLYFSSTSKRLTFVAVTDAGIPADDRLTQGASSLTFTATCDNPVALDALTLGSEHYIDISPAVLE